MSQNAKRLAEGIVEPDFSAIWFQNNLLPQHLQTVRALHEDMLLELIDSLGFRGQYVP